MSKSPAFIKQLYSHNNMEFEHIPTPGSSQHSDENERSDAKKPSKSTRKQRVTQFIKKINEDNMQQVTKDVLIENKRLRKEIESLRVANASLKREYEELMHSILKDRLKNQGCDFEF